MPLTSLPRASMPLASMPLASMPLRLPNPIRAAAAALAALALAVAAASAGSTAAIAQDRDDLARIMERGTVRVAMSHSPPNLVKDVVTGDWSGPYADLYRSIFATIDVEVVFVDTPWGGMIPGLQSGDVDLALLAVLPARAVAVDYSDPVEFSPLAVLLPDAATDEAVTWEALDREGFRFSAISGGVHAQMLETILTDAQIVPSVDYNGGILQLETGRADAVAGHINNIGSYVKERGLGRVVVPEPAVGMVSAIAFRPDNPALKRFLNAGLLSHRMDGSMRAFFSAAGTADFLYE